MGKGLKLSYSSVQKHTVCLIMNETLINRKNDHLNQLIIIMFQKGSLLEWFKVPRKVVSIEED